MLVAVALLLPWAFTEEGVFFGALDQLPPDRPTAWQRFAFEDLVLLAVAVLLVAVGATHMRGRTTRVGLVVCAIACLAAGAFAVVHAVAPPDLAGGGRGTARYVLGTSPGPGPFVSLAGLAAGLIVALATLVRGRRGATV